MRLEQKFTCFKSSFREKEGQHAIEIKRLKSEAKTSSSLKHKSVESNTSLEVRFFTTSSHVLLSVLVEIYQKLIPNLSVQSVNYKVLKPNKLIRFSEKSSPR